MPFDGTATKPAPVLLKFEPTSDIGQAARRRRRLERTLNVLSPLMILITWELLVRSKLLDIRLFSAPSSIFETFETLLRSGELLKDISVSMTRIAIGFMLGGIPGILVGLAMGLSPIVRAVVAPIVAALYPIPKIALFPLVLVVFGLGEMSKYVLVAMAVFFFMTINTFTGVNAIDRTLWDVGTSFKLPRWRMVVEIALPGALPMIIAGIKLSLGVSLLVLVGAEFVGAKSGIGYLVWNSWEVFDVESMFVGIVVIGFLGWAFFAIVDEIERHVIPWT